MEVCPLGFFCFDKNTFILLIIAIIIVMVYYIHNNSSKFEIDKHKLTERKNEFDELKNELEKTNNNIKELKQETINNEALDSIRINDFKDAVTYLHSLGYQVIRMGAKVEGELEIESTLYFDYARSGIRSDLLDLFLISQCSFFVSNGSGIDFVPSLFRDKSLTCSA